MSCFFSGLDTTFGSFGLRDNLYFFLLVASVDEVSTALHEDAVTTDSSLFFLNLLFVHSFLSILLLVLV